MSKPPLNKPVYINKSLEIIACAKCNSIFQSSTNFRVIRINGSNFFLTSTKPNILGPLKQMRASHLRTRSLATIWRDDKTIRVHPLADILSPNPSQPKTEIENHSGEHQKGPFFDYFKSDGLAFPLVFFAKSDFILEDSKTEDFDCIYERLLCYHCSARIGKRYITGNRRMMRHVGSALLDALKTRLVVISPSAPFRIRKMDSPGDPDQGDDQPLRVKIEEGDFLEKTRRLRESIKQESGVHVETGGLTLTQKRAIGNDPGSRSSGRAQTGDLISQNRDTNKEQNVSRGEEHVLETADSVQRKFQEVRRMNEGQVRDVQNKFERLVTASSEDDSLIDELEQKSRQLYLDLVAQYKEIKILRDNFSSLK